MIKNSLMKFIDSCVGNIARQIEDEFRESDHPRDKGGKFTSKGNEGRGGYEEDNGSDVSLEQYKKNVSENFDGDEEYEVEARYDRAKYHSDKFKKLQNGEYDGTPEEKRLKSYYRRLGIKKPEDAFKVWWDI